MNWKTNCVKQLCNNSIGWGCLLAITGLTSILKLLYYLFVLVFMWLIGLDREQEMLVFLSWGPFALESRRDICKH